MTTKHTPGPWKLGKYTNSNKYHVYPEKGGPIVFECVEQDQEAMANAALIASAPEMLNALKHVLRDLEEAGVNADQPQLRVVQSAIDKAEGGLS